MPTESVRWLNINIRHNFPEFREKRFIGVKIEVGF
jgi:hypothetical protein